MKATDFEYHNRTLVHQFIVAAAFLTYLIDRDDIVWRFVKNGKAPREPKRFVFTVATLFIAVGAGICTWARASRRPESTTAVGPYRYFRHPRHLGELLVVGEALRLFRLMRRQDAGAQSLPQHPLDISPSLASARPREPDRTWKKAFRQETVKWGLLLTMIVYVITLKDRLAEILAAASFLAGLLFNAPFLSNSSTADEST